MTDWTPETGGITTQAQRDAMLAEQLAEDAQRRTAGLRAAGVDDDILGEVLAGYAGAYLWTHSDDTHEDYDPEVGGDPHLDANYSPTDIAGEVLDTWRDMLAGFIAAHPIAFRMYRGGRDSQWSSADLFGHDFLLTQDGHGAGFWDRGLGELGEYLTDKVRPYGESDYLYPVDGKLVR